MSLRKIAENHPLLENILGTAAQMGAHLINEQDWFAEDSLLEKIPYGKIVAWMARKSQEIGTANAAYNHAYAVAYFLCFSQAVKRYKVLLENSDLVKIKNEEKANTEFPLDHDELIKTDIFKHYSEKYRLLMIECKVPEHTQKTISNYILWNLKIVFHEILENQPITYKKLTDELSKKSFTLRKEKLPITRYYQEQKNLFLSPVLGDDRGMTLKDVYIAPGYRIHQNSIDKNNLDTAFVESDFLDQDRNTVSIFREPKQKNYATIHELLSDFVNDKSIKDPIKHPQTRALIILGYPGQGKTSCIRRLLSDQIQDPDNPPLIYHLPLRSIENVSHFCDAPFEVIKEHMIDKHLPIEYVNNLIKNGTIILEGMDELSIQSGTQRKTIDDVLKELLRTQEQRNVKLIITSRLGYIDCDQFIKKNILITQLKEFSIEQQLTWLSKYKIFYPECKIESTTLADYNQANSHLSELINQPILLHMVVTAEIHATKNINRAQLYQSIFDALINRQWADADSTAHQISILEDLEAEDLREIIQDIALAVFHSGKNAIQKEELIKLEAVQRHLTSQLGFDKIGGALKGVMVAFYFQETTSDPENTESKDYGIEFLHKSLGEYMAAEKIWKEIKTFSERRSNKRYLIDSVHDTLELLNRLFAPQLLTKEVHDYLLEMMENDPDYNPNELSKRLSHFFTELLQKQFLYKYDSKSDHAPIHQAIHTFYGFWTILSFLGEKLEINYLKGLDQSLFIFLVKTCSLLLPPYLSFAHQNLVITDLSLFDLSRANLYKADLYKAFLSRTNLFYAYLHSTNLHGAYLYKANLRDAVLAFANLQRANLTDADLQGANLTGANLTDADLQGANLYHCKIDRFNYEYLKSQNIDVSGCNVIDD